MVKDIVKRLKYIQQMEIINIEYNFIDSKMVVRYTHSFKNFHMLHLRLIALKKQ